MILGREEQFDFEEVSKDESRRISFDMKTRTGAKTPAHEVEDEGDVIKVTMEDAPTTIQVHTADGQTLEVVAAAPTTVVTEDQEGEAGEGGAGVTAAIVGSGVDMSEISGLDNIWSAGKNALRDLLVYLVRKHHIDEVYDSKVRSRPYSHTSSLFFWTF